MGSSESRVDEVSSASAFDELGLGSVGVLPGVGGSKPSADTERRKVSKEHVVAGRRTFPLPKGWRVVCRLSPSDPRSRWGSRPRPAAGLPNGTSGANGACFEANLIAPELRHPLKVPLQLLPQWTEPEVGVDFLGRFEVRKELPRRPGCKGQAFFEVLDKRDKRAERSLRVLDLAKEADVRAFAERLQLEFLDSDSKLFLKLHDLSVAIPSRMAVVEDAIRGSLWQELQGLKPGKELVAQVGAVANATLAGLRRLHANGWAHCGVTPHSVVLTPDGCWKLTGLESARRVRSISGASKLRKLGSVVPPEVLLGLHVSEKLDVWQLGVTITEAIVQQRVEAEDDVRVDVAERLCRLIDLVGPLPESLVSRHPHREELFTPEGHVLRPTTPDACGLHEVEAIEPVVSLPEAARSAPPGAVDNGPTPRPRVLVERLASAEGSADILEFLGRLLIPDPEQRPSAGEALAHHFLRFAHTKGGSSVSEEKKVVGFGGVEDGRQKNGHTKIQIQDSFGDTDGKIQRKGTGFVHLGELPPSSDEDEADEEDPRPANGKSKAKTGSGGSGSKKHGTGLVRMGDEDSPVAEKQPGKPAARIQDDGLHDEGKIVRKGTGFVHVGELPPSDDEDEEEEEGEQTQARKVQTQVQDDGQHDEGRVVRKGTGFVHVGELPPSDDEDDDDDEDKSPKGHARFEDDGLHSDNRIERKGTGFVHVGELPPSDDEDEEEDDEEERLSTKAKARVQDDGKHDEGKVVRKGTGFVHVGELPPSDDEEEEDEEEEERTTAVKVQDDGQHDDNKIVRKGTGFVHVGELPPSDDEEEEDEDGDGANREQCVKIEDDGTGDNGGQIARKGTGFVHLGDLPSSDDEEDEDDESPAPKPVAAASGRKKPQFKD